MTEQEKFEEVYASNDLRTRPEPRHNEYVLWDIQCRWEGWQAAIESRDKIETRVKHLRRQ